MFGSKNPKEDELRDKLVGVIIRIEEINKESSEMVSEMSKLLTSFEEEYHKQCSVLGDDLPNNKKINDLRSRIDERWKFVLSAMETITNKDASVLDKNSLYVMIIKSLWEMHLCYRTLISEIDYVCK